MKIKLNQVSHNTTKSTKSRLQARKQARRSVTNAALATGGAFAVVVGVALVSNYLAVGARWSGSSAGLWFGAIVITYLVGSAVMPRSRR